MTTYAVARLEDIAELDDGREPYRPVRHHFGISSFGATAWTGKQAGDRIINEHAEDDDGGHEELYVVLTGRATFVVADDRVDAPTGTFVFVPPGTTRTAFAEEAGTTILALGGAPGKAYRVEGWELWAPVNPLYKAGRYEEAAERGREVAEAFPYPNVLYNLACCESLAGQKDEALEHLRRSIELNAQFREYARNDTDLDAIRSDPAFERLLVDA